MIQRPLLFLATFLFVVSCSEFGSKQKFTSHNQMEAEPVVPDPEVLSTEEKIYKFQFSKEKQPKVPHYLLMVIDNSVTMLYPNASGKTYFQIFKDGMQKVAAKHPDVLFGSISTMVHDPGKPGTIYPKIHTYDGMNLEPGFNALINASSINRFLNQTGIPSEVRSLFSLAGCESSWVTHAQRNQLGQSCLDSIMQISHFPVGPEPGGLALKQFIERNGSAGVPPGSFFQVVFISDEANPGYAERRLIDLCPTADELVSAIQSTYKPFGLRIHGIVRHESGSRTITNSNTVPFVEDRGVTMNVERCQYQHSIRKTGGAEVDILKATDYDSLVNSILQPMDESILIQHALPEEVKKITKVLVNGKDYTASYTLSPSRDIVIRFQSKLLQFDIEVHYEL